jgi:hypothetical protein
MTSGQDVSEYLDILGLVKSYFSSFFGEKKIKKSRIFFFVVLRPEDEAICLFAGLLANPDVPLSPGELTNPFFTVNKIDVWNRSFFFL